MYNDGFTCRCEVYDVPVWRSEWYGANSKGIPVKKHKEDSGVTDDGWLSDKQINDETLTPLLEKSWPPLSPCLPSLPGIHTHTSPTLIVLLYILLVHQHHHYHRRVVLVAIAHRRNHEIKVPKSRDRSNWMTARQAERRAFYCSETFVLASIRLFTPRPAVS